MKNCLIVGRPGVGKTLFVLNFAEFLGQHSITVTTEKPDYSVSAQTITTREARDRLVGKPGSHHMTRNVQAVTVAVPAGKARVQVEFHDTPGISEGINPDPAIRTAMAQTLRKVQFSDLIIHLLESISAKVPALESFPGDVDCEIAQYGRLHGRYLILVNKMDLASGEERLTMVRAAFPGTPVLGISAMTKRGFREVSLFIRDHL